MWTLSATVKAAMRSPVPKSPAASCSRAIPRTRLRTLPSMMIIAAPAMPPKERATVGRCFVTLVGKAVSADAMPGRYPVPAQRNRYQTIANDRAAKRPSGMRRR